VEAQQIASVTRVVSVPFYPAKVVEVEMERVPAVAADTSTNQEDRLHFLAKEMPGARAIRLSTAVAAAVAVLALSEATVQELLVERAALERRPQ
jgi:hypothetical protein